MVKGSHHTDDTKAKLRAINLGKSSYVRTPEIRKRNSDALKGKPSSNPWTAESKSKFIRTRTGMPLKSSTHVYGFIKKHKYIIKEQFELLLCSVISRDKNKCVVCGECRVSKLVVHHVVPCDIGKDSRLCDSKSNLITLCRRCHPRVHGGRKPNNVTWKKFLPFAEVYLARFNYKKLLLSKFI